MPLSPLASIIIPTWNGKVYIEDCLNSLLAQDYPDFEIILVDNASGDGTPDLVAQRYPEVKLICNKQNLGFAGGVNVGLRAAKGQVLILFNQDIITKPGWLVALVSGLLAEPTIGIAGCKILNIDSNTIQHAGGYLTMPQALPSHFGVGQVDMGQFDQPKDVDFVTGAVLALRRDVLDAVGYFDESFFFYYEDVDYCYRTRNAGFRVVYVPQAVLYHYGKTSLVDRSAAYHTRLHTSRLQFVIKHWGGSYFVSQFKPAELKAFKNLAPEEWVGLRQAYQKAMIEGAGRMGKHLSFDDDTQAELLAALYDLRQQIYNPYSPDTLRPPDEPLGSQAHLPDRWWEVEERTFTSLVPLVGPLIAGFRTVWNSISTKWFVRAIRHQQNRVNYILAKHLEAHSHTLHNLDQDQTRLTMQVAEILYRLDKIESRLMALEQKR